MDNWIPVDLVWLVLSITCNIDRAEFPYIMLKRHHVTNIWYFNTSEISVFFLIG